MTWLVFVRPEAERDIESARDWYDAISPRLGDEFLDEFAIAIRFLGTSPESQRRYYRAFRRLLLRRFPYKVFYQVIGNRVVVFRVLHVRECHEAKLR